MKTAVLGALRVLGVLGVLAAPGVAQQLPPRDTRSTSPATATGRIAGVVTTDDAQPRPLRRARVILSGSPNDVPRSTITSDDGSFVFDRVPAGRVNIGATRDGYLSMNYGATRTGRPGSGVQIADGQNIRVTIALPRGGVITGTVTDVDGQPAAGMLVIALARRFAGGQGEFRYLATGMPNPSTTDDRGVYRIFGLPAGDYFISVQPQTRQLGNPGTELRTMTRGEISDRAIALSQVFHPSAIDIGHAARVAVGAGEERAGVDVQRQYLPLAAVSGTAPSNSGSTLMLTMVRTDDVPGFDAVRVIRVDASGRFTIAAVPPGQYRILARSTLPQAGASRGAGLPFIDTQYGFADVTVSGEDVDNVVIAIQQPLTVSGQLKFEGETPPPATLSQDTRAGLPLFMTVANAGIGAPVAVINGSSFRLEGVAPGRYLMSLTARGIQTPIGQWWVKSVVVGGRDVLDAPIELQQSVQDAVVTLGDTASQIGGVVRDGQGTPSSDRYVVVFSTDRLHWFFNSRRVVGVRPDRDGRYTIRNLPPGDYRIAAADLDQYEWFDASVLERLLPVASPLTIAGTEKKTVDLAVR